MMKKFGSLPKGEYLKKISSSKNYIKNKFMNLTNENKNYTNKNNIFKTLGVIRKIISLQKQPLKIQSMKTSLKTISTKQDVIVWLGHSSYFVQINEERFLIDPVLSNCPSPVPFFPKAIEGSNIISPEDIPDIDFLIITHDHWDHLDFETIKQLKFKKVICPLGVGAHFNKWGYSNIVEMDWNESIQTNKNSEIYCLPANHFSGRGFFRNKTLWASFLIKTYDNFKLFISGDGGYGTHFSEIGKKFFKIDVAILENGQYNKYWRDIHMFPEQTVQAALDLNASSLLPSHNSKFFLSNHNWNEPLIDIYNLSQNKPFKLLTPIIGEIVDLKNKNQIYKKWWES